MHLFQSNLFVQKTASPLSSSWSQDNATLHIHSHLDRRLRYYASCGLLMGGENDLVKPEAFFRSLLAFHEEGLYEVPYI